MSPICPKIGVGFAHGRRTSSQSVLRLGGGRSFGSNSLRREREQARYRMHLVKHRTTLKNRVHSTLIAHAHQAPVSNLFGAQGRRLLASLELPEPWAATTTATLELIDAQTGSPERT